MKYFPVLLLLFIGCSQKSTTTKKITDAHSFADPSQAIVKHLDLDINVDFETETIDGKASWKIDNVSRGIKITFDVNTLQIDKITLGTAEKATTFELGKSVPFHGQPLIVAIEPTTTLVHIYYKTTKEAVALQWLKPAQTADKNKPFLFSQGQSIWTRTWIPCQDSPGIRFSYHAKVTVPKDLMAVMSAVNPQQRNDSGIYNFKQDRAIPSYLMAIAVGDIAFKAIDNRTGVYAEHSLLEKSALEFAKLGEMVKAAENLYGPYRWGRYDVLVLPPSFPYGGMENPNLTFLTPGILAGDRSLTNLLAHELGHSWSGNLVTNASWDDMWLNEGFTTYVEHRIGEKIFGVDEAKMHDVVSRKLFYDNVAELGKDSPDTKLAVTIGNRNPDDALTDIPYEKGYAFLQVIENAVGRKKFDAFVKNWFDKNAFKSVTTDDFVKYLNAELIKGDKSLEEKIQAQKWIYGTGIPDNVIIPISPAFDEIDKIQQTWRKNGVVGLSKIINSTAKKQHFIDHLPDDITTAEMAAIDAEFDFTKSGNFVIKRQWFVPAIRHQYKVAYPAIEEFMIATSRTGSLQTLYKEMVKTREGKAWAREIFAKAKTGYHLTTVQSVEGLLK